MEDLDLAKTTDTDASVEKASVEETSVAEDVKEANNPTEVAESQEDSNVVETQKPMQTKEENAEFARQRREKELQAKLDKTKEETRIQTIIDVIGTNPYTQEKLENELDVRIYEEMKKYENNGGDPVTDQAKIIKSIMKNDSQKKQEEINQQNEQTARSNKAKSEIDEIQKAYPDLNVKQLLDDENFKDYADGKVGVKTLKQIYDGYLKFTTPKTQVNKQVREEANNNASVGSLKGEASQPTGLLTREQIANMSRKEILDKYELVQKSMASWRK